MPYPGVNVSVSSNNLMRSVPVLDAVCALIVTVATAALKGAVKQVYSLADAEQKGFTALAEPFAHRLIEEFYNELGGNQRLFILGTDEAKTMAEVVAASYADGITKLITAGGGDINLVAIARKPASAYSAGSGFLDADVAATVLASKSVCQSLQAANKPIRLFIEGRIADDTAENNYEPNEATNNYAAVVLGGTKNDGSASVTLALARASKYGAHVKLGNGMNGALSATQIYIGSDPIEERLDMETLHDAGFLTFQKRQGAAGYYFGVDNMCSDDDCKILAHGRILDKAQRIAAKAYLPYVENSLAVNDDGTINATDAKHLEDVLKSAILSQMGGQISNAAVVIDTSQDIVNTSTLNVQLAVLPLGYTTWINVTVGLTNEISA